MPTKPSDAKGFVCAVEVINGSTEGYLRLRLTATPSTGTFPGDRLIRIRAIPSGTTRPKQNTTYQLSMTLPAGATTITENFYLPKYTEGGGITIRLSDNDGPLKSYECSFAFNPPQTNGNLLITSSDFIPRLTIILPDAKDVGTAPWAVAPDLRSIDAIVQVDPSYSLSPDVKRLTHDEAILFMDRSAFSVHQRLTASDCPKVWLGYESSDIVLVPFEILKTWKASGADQYEALRQWVSTGGVVWTYGVSGEAELAEQFDVRPLQDNLSAALVASAEAAYSPVWRQPRLSNIQNPNQAMLFGTNNSPIAPLNDIVEIIELGGGGKQHPAIQKRTKGELIDSIFPLTVEAGVVVGFRDQDPFPGTIQDWFIAQAVTGSNQRFESRRAVSVVRGSIKYWTWLLANVARPPVYAFLMLLTVFVLLVGPISFYFTRRAGRSYLMFLIAPALATITTLTLFGYGFIADGFGTKVRMRQITWIDGASGRGSSMNRATYFTAFRPASGLRFDSDTAVYPIYSHEMVIPNSYLDDQPPRFDRSIEITDGEQALRGEFLPSRTQSQFLSYRPLVQTKTLSVNEIDGEAELTNTLDTILREFFVCLPSGNYYHLLNPLLPGETAKLISMESDKVGSTMRLLYLESQPEVPLGYSAQNQYSIGTYRLNEAEGILNGLNIAWSEPGEDYGIFETRLRGYMTNSAKLPPNQFVGIVDVDPSQSAVDGAEVLESIHFIMGTLR